MPKHGTALPIEIIHIVMEQIFRKRVFLNPLSAKHFFNFFPVANDKISCTDSFFRSK